MNSSAKGPSSCSMLLNRSFPSTVGRWGGHANSEVYKLWKSNCWSQKPGRQQVALTQIICHHSLLTLTLPRASLVAQMVGKESACNAGDLGSFSGLERSPGGRHGSPFQYSCLENPHGQRSLAGYSPCGHKEPADTFIFTLIFLTLFYISQYRCYAHISLDLLLRHLIFWMLL